MSQLVALRTLLAEEDVGCAETTATSARRAVALLEPEAAEASASALGGAGCAARLASALGMSWWICTP